MTKEHDFSFLKMIRQTGRNLTATLKIRAVSGFNPEHPVFTVIMPVYDREQELAQSIESVLTQTFQNFELILVCDGSPEATLAVIDSYANNPHVRIHKFADNTGNACRGRNKAVKMARGEFAAFLDSDDIALPNRLYDTLSAFYTLNADIVYGAARFIVDGSRSQPGVPDGLVLPPPPFDIEQAKHSNPVITSTAAVRLSCLARFGAFRPEMRYREDHELWLRLAHNNCKFAWIGKTLAAYRLHSGNAELRFKDKDEYWQAEMLRLYSMPYGNSDPASIDYNNKERG